MKLDFDPGPVNATAYAAKLPDGRTLVGVINKDTGRGLGIVYPKWQLGDTLTAPELNSTKARFVQPTNPRATQTPGGSAAIFEARA